MASIKFIRSQAHSTHQFKNMPDDGPITAETCRPDVINITYLCHLRVVVA
jgi:hypothetical protein